MTYGLSTRAFIENGSFGQLSKVEASRSPARPWRVLSDRGRLEAIEQALRSAS